MNQRRLERQQANAPAAPPAPPKKEKLGDNIPTYAALQKKYKTNVSELGEDHEKLIE